MLSFLLTCLLFLLVFLAALAVAGAIYVAIYMIVLTIFWQDVIEEYTENASTREFVKTAFCYARAKNWLFMVCSTPFLPIIARF